jgi:hypothetical protein
MAADAAAMSITCKARRIFDCHRIHGTLHMSWRGPNTMRGQVVRYNAHQWCALH